MIKDTVFQQILKPLTKELMHECSRRFMSDYDCEKLTTYEHLKIMIYGHLTGVQSLRTLEVAINSQKIGMKYKMKRSTLSDANHRRPSTCFFWLLEHLMSLLPRKMNKEINKFIRILDSSPIILKGRGYDEWAKEFATNRCQGLKLHIEYDLELSSLRRLAISHPNYNDISMGQIWPIESDSIYVFDKGYYDFNWWWKIHQKRAFFVTRLKRNTAIVIKHQQAVGGKKIAEEGIFTFKNKHPRGGKINLYQEELRYIKVLREGKDPLVLVTNVVDLSAEQIAEVYQARWEIELFFKWIKQNLKIKKFLGKSENAVKIQIVTALIAYLLVQLFKKVSSDNRRLQLVLVWARYNLHAILRKAKKYRPPPIYQFSTLSWINKRGVQL